MSAETPHWAAMAATVVGPYPSRRNSSQRRMPSPAPGQEFKGQLKVGMHKVKMQANTLYQIVLDAPRESFPLVDVPGGRLSISHTGGRQVKAYLIRHLLEAIEIKEAYDRSRNPRGEAR